jgi:hypothetical protein
MRLAVLSLAALLRWACLRPRCPGRAGSSQASSTAGHDCPTLPSALPSHIRSALHDRQYAEFDTAAIQNGGDARAFSDPGKVQSVTSFPPAAVPERRFRVVGPPGINWTNPLRRPRPAPVLPGGWDRQHRRRRRRDGRGGPAIRGLLAEKRSRVRRSSGLSRRPGSSRDGLAPSPAVRGSCRWMSGCRGRRRRPGSRGTVALPHR